MTLRSVLFVLTLVGLLAIVLQPGRKNPVPAPSSDAVMKTGVRGTLSLPIARLAMAGNLAGAPLRSYDEFHPGLALSGDSSLSVTAVAVWTVLDCPAPLPANISSGEYLVTNSRGTLGRLVVPATNGRSLGHGADVTAITAGPIAWVFVRQGDVTDQAAGVANLPVKRLYLNRKFDFTGAEHPPEDGRLSSVPAATLR